MVLKQGYTLELPYQLTNFQGSGSNINPADKKVHISDELKEERSIHICASLTVSKLESLRDLGPKLQCLLKAKYYLS